MTDSTVEPHDIPSDLIESVLRHAKGMRDSGKRHGSLQSIGLSELTLVLESRLSNASRLACHALLQPDERRNVLRSIAALDHLICEALELCRTIRRLRSEEVIADH
ncbi:MAG TPA: hypothetical protein VIM98_05515 [Dyella sp.]|uniref:hypothetical protein n=1 Tax=Dyella sp. TaxID=1869338 RepID=UPI002F95CB80